MERIAVATSQLNPAAFYLGPTWGAAGQGNTAWSDDLLEYTAVSESRLNPSAFYLGRMWGAAGQGTIEWTDSFSTIIRSNAYWG